MYRSAHSLIDSGGFGLRIKAQGYRVLQKRLRSSGEYPGQHRINRRVCQPVPALRKVLDGNRETGTARGNHIPVKIHMAVHAPEDPGALGLFRDLAGRPLRIDLPRDLKSPSVHADAVFPRGFNNIVVPQRFLQFFRAMRFLWIQFAEPPVKLFLPDKVSDPHLPGRPGQRWSPGPEAHTRCGRGRRMP